MADIHHHPYVILSRPARRGVAGTGFDEDLSFRSLGAQAFDSERPDVQVRALDLQELRAVQQDPAFDVAPAMPLALIQPMDGAVIAPSAAPPWGLVSVGATTTDLQGDGIAVAVLDTGIDKDHEAFAHLGGALLTENFTTDPPADTNGHGTHCAGTIFGKSVGGTRIGIAPQVAKALVGKVLGSGSDSSTLVKAIQWACDNGAHVISMSLGIDYAGFTARLIEQGLPPDLAASKALQGYRDNVRLFDTMAELVRARGFSKQPTVIVAAAGNESRANVDPKFLIGLGVPAAADGVISVGALGKTDAGFSVAPFSNVGPTLSGPGVDILSAKVGGGLKSLSGTSMATPHVAGVAALWLQHMKKSGMLFTAENLRANLMGSASPLLALGAGRVGAGLVRVPQ